ncbi:MAG: IPTL-CTERM sorting domain-containing protein [Deltaproteobacteria bacterium]|nr:IPTL-CTERM sorting domain-containing protein [Deltaproteobacteria bacterium]
MAGSAPVGALVDISYVIQCAGEPDFPVSGPSDVPVVESPPPVIPTLGIEGVVVLVGLMGWTALYAVRRKSPAR